MPLQIFNSLDEMFLDRPKWKTWKLLGILLTVFIFPHAGKFMIDIFFMKVYLFIFSNTKKIRRIYEWENQKTEE